MSKTIEDIYCFCRRPADPKDFWKLNEEMSFLPEFADFKKKKNSAKIMTAIYMIYDPKSQLNNGGVEERDSKKAISKNFLGDENFPWQDYGTIIRAYQKYSKTKIEKALDNWWQQLQERNEFLSEEMEWDEDPAAKDKMLLATDQHFEKFNTIKKTLADERFEALSYGNYTKSELEAWGPEG